MAASATPVHDRAFDDLIELAERLGVGRECLGQTAAQVQARCASPVLRNGVFFPSAATVQPARLARGLRRVLLERGVTIHEGTRLVGIDGSAGGVGRGRRPSGPVELRTDAGRRARPGSRGPGRASGSTPGRRPGPGPSDGSSPGRATSS